MWSEPLTVDSRIIDIGRDGDVDGFATTVRQQGGTMVAQVRCISQQQARTGFFGEMKIVDQQGRAPPDAARAACCSCARRSASRPTWASSTCARNAAAHAVLRGARSPARARASSSATGRAPLARRRTRDGATHALETSDADGNVVRSHNNSIDEALATSSIPRNRGRHRSTAAPASRQVAGRSMGLRPDGGAGRRTAGRSRAQRGGGARS